MANLNRIIIIVGLAVLALLLNGCGAWVSSQATPTPIPTPAIPVKPVYVVQRGDITDLIRFTGRIAPIQEIELAFGVNGWIDEVRVKAGDEVKAGTMLASLDTGSQANNLRRAQIQVEMAQHELELFKQEMLIARQTSSMTIAAAAYQVELAQTALEELRSSGYTGTPLRQAEIDLELAQMEEALARQQAAYHITADEVHLERLALELELAQIALGELEQLIADSQIVAPLDGRIASVNIKADTAIEAYKVAIIILDLTTLLIRGDPGDAGLQRLEEGMPIKISPIGQPGTILTGNVLSLPYPYGSGESGQEDAFFVIDEQSPISSFDLGDLMEISVVLNEKQNILWLPPQAIRTFEGRKFVVIQAGEGQQRVDVKIGIQMEDRVEILEGLEEGQTVYSP